MNTIQNILITGFFKATSVKRMMSKVGVNNLTHVRLGLESGQEPGHCLQGKKNGLMAI